MRNQLSKYVKAKMKAHWKSSEDPLYVRIIYKKGGLRHALLNNETGTQSHYFTNVNSHQRPSLLHSPRKTEATLETCFAKSKLRTYQHLLEEQEHRKSTPLLRDKPIKSVISVTKPVTKVCSTEFFDEYSESTPTYGKNEWPRADFEDVTFADRIIRWLYSSNLLSQQHLNHGTIGACEYDKKRRGKRATTAKPFKKNNFRDEEEVRSLFEESYTAKDKISPDSISRPQLHVYIPMFEKERVLSLTSK